jgi:glycerophosphoryl diester phosphodiesterase
VAPENTLPALTSAAKVGSDYVELDVRWTRSGVAVLMHDATVNRTTTSAGYVASLWYYQAAKLDAGARFSPAYAGTRVPTLGAALRALASTGSTALVELKVSPTNAQLTDFAKAIGSNGMAGRVVVQSAYPDTLRRLRAVAPTVPQALLTGFYPTADPLGDAKKAGVEYWLPVWHSLTEAAVSEARAAGLKVMPWTVNEPAKWEQMAAWGVDGIITDRAGEYRGWAIARCGQGSM